jgi:hypothetical protein
MGLVLPTETIAARTLTIERAYCAWRAQRRRRNRSASESHKQMHPLGAPNSPHDMWKSQEKHGVAHPIVCIVLANGTSYWTSGTDRLTP